MEKAYLPTQRFALPQTESTSTSAGLPQIPSGLPRLSSLPRVSQPELPRVTSLPRANSSEDLFFPKAEVLPRREQSLRREQPRRFSPPSEEEFMGPGRFSRPYEEEPERFSRSYEGETIEAVRPTRRSRPIPSQPTPYLPPSKAQITEIVNLLQTQYPEIYEELIAASGIVEDLQIHHPRIYQSLRNQSYRY